LRAQDTPGPRFLDRMPKGLELAGKIMQNTPRVVQILLGPIKPREDTARPQFITLKPQSPRLATKKNQ